jgi:hypothetical protein
VVIPGLCSPGSAASGHVRGGGPPAGRGGIPVGGGPAGSYSGAPADGRGGGPAGGSSTASAPSKGKGTHAILDDDEVSSDEDKPLHKRQRQLFSAGSIVLDEAAAADKEATDKRAVGKRAMEDRVMEEATVKVAAAEEAAGKTADEVVGATEGSPAPDQAPSATGAKRAMAPSGPTSSAKHPYGGVWNHRFVQLSLPLFFFSSGASFSYYTFCPGPLPPAWSPRRTQLLLP